MRGVSGGGNNGALVTLGNLMASRAFPGFAAFMPNTCLSKGLHGVVMTVIWPWL